MGKCVCVFDIDGTLTCGSKSSECTTTKNMQESIRHCEQSECAVVINTARPDQPDIMHGIDATTRAMIDGVPVYNRPTTSRMNVAEHKLYNMSLIAKDYNTKPEQTILVDDVFSNCVKVQEEGGMRAIHVPKAGGITADNLSALKRHVQDMGSTS